MKLEKRQFLYAANFVFHHILLYTISPRGLPNKYNSKPGSQVFIVPLESHLNCCIRLVLKDSVSQLNIFRNCLSCRVNMRTLTLWFYRLLWCSAVHFSPLLKSLKPLLWVVLGTLLLLSSFTAEMKATAVFIWFFGSWHLMVRIFVNEQTIEALPPFIFNFKSSNVSL